jgi:hypothetical protein
MAGVSKLESCQRRADLKTTNRLARMPSADAGSETIRQYLTQLFDRLR